MNDSVYPRDKKTYLIITAHHDYRTPRRSSIHFIADELAKRGSVKFFSLRYSFLSKYKGDIRIVIDSRANRLEKVNGVECYLWKTLIHPFNIKNIFFSFIENAIFWLYERSPNKVMMEWIKQADVIIYESGIAPIFFSLAKKLNPTAKHIYRGSDDLATINVAKYAKTRFDSICHQMDYLCLLSKKMAVNIGSKNNVFFVPNGLNNGIDELGDPSPYGIGIHAVSIGSMLFDSKFFEIASHAFPNVTFHLIGTGHPHMKGYNINVVVYDDMKFSETIRYIKHAKIGIAPYVSNNVPVYLADSSLKMMQYDYFALPTVCPVNVTGEYESRFGYTPGDPESIKSATAAALAANHVRSRQIFTWDKLVDRLLNPKIFPDTHI